MSVQGAGQILDNAVSRGEQKLHASSKQASSEVQSERIRTSGQETGQQLAKTTQAESASYRITISEQGRDLQRGKMLHPTPRLIG
ncbi:hypothetical protein Mmc1_1452 [Magnetococcus marinus MC-1]|uniref:Uncharacterized protein n=1 Tax=Magnetococcus marinus (strain ATCC BAA-1437 / JCM 17883 / MC-1) TaxID=156889 RepID=A0L7L8_MAGMM|nr:hypothetical protein [Magnetococcus marinus]ABK43961.1 hypothetical protein Mmc1_1452 [Magnetococcus marinus MC-1]